MVHIYPAVPPATDAVLVDPPHTGEAAATAALGAAKIDTSLLPDDTLQPPLLVTFTDSVAEPDMPAV